jgi:chemotaxis protein histidine kinase CheA
MEKQQIEAQIKQNYLVLTAEQVNLPDDLDNEIFEELVEVTCTKLDEIESKSLQFENGNLDKDEFVSSVMRTLHSMKGEFAICQIEQVRDLCHLMESLINADHENPPIDTILAFKDWLNDIMQKLGRELCG